MKIVIYLLTMVFGIASQEANISATPLAIASNDAQPQLLAQSGQKYVCESYQTTQGTAYRIRPNISGSFIQRGSCYVPVSAVRRCNYKNSYTDDQWYECGKVACGEPFCSLFDG